MEEFTLIGLKSRIPVRRGYELCPKFWDIFNIRYLSKINDGSEESKAIIDNNIGEFAVCIDDNDEGVFTYAICGKYNGGKVPFGMSLIKFESMSWAKFKCVGPMPQALQEVNTKIWNEWIPSKEFELLGNTNIEWYSDGDTDSKDYKSEIWIPVKDKN